MFTVHIKNNKTGEIREYVEENEDWFDGFNYLWTEGNYACDCNRALYFARAAREDIWKVDQECDESVYSVPFVILEDGTKIIIEDS